MKSGEKLVEDKELYRLVFDFAEVLWSQYCESGIRNGSKVWQYVLIEQYDATDDTLSVCMGKVRKAWVRDNSGLREIDIAEHNNYRRKGHRAVWRYVLVEFFIYPDKSRIVIGERFAARGGTGGRYLIKSTEKGFKLESDPNSGFWIS